MEFSFFYMTQNYIANAESNKVAKEVKKHNL